MNALKEAMLLLVANDRPLPPDWLNHPLTGDWIGHRECHIGGNFLLIYRLDDSGKRVSIPTFHDNHRARIPKPATPSIPAFDIRLSMRGRKTELWEIALLNF